MRWHFQPLSARPKKTWQNGRSWRGSEGDMYGLKAGRPEREHVQGVAWGVKPWDLIGHIHVKCHPGDTYGIYQTGGGTVLLNFCFLYFCFQCSFHSNIFVRCHTIRITCSENVLKCEKVLVCACLCVCSKHLCINPHCAWDSGNTTVNEEMQVGM